MCLGSHAGLPVIGMRGMKDILCACLCSFLYPAMSWLASHLLTLTRLNTLPIFCAIHCWRLHPFLGSLTSRYSGGILTSGLAHLWQLPPQMSERVTGSKYARVQVGSLCCLFFLGRFCGPHLGLFKFSVLSIFTFPIFSYSPLGSSFLF